MAMRPRGGGGGGAGPSRRPGRATAGRPVYETFKPVFERLQEEAAEKILIYLPGFLKDNIRVSTEGKSTVRVRGERLVAGNKLNRFLEEFQAPEDCNMGGIHARFENGILLITMPITKKIPPAIANVTKQKETDKHPIIPPPLGTTQDDHFPPLTSQTTSEVQKQPPLQPKPISQPTAHIQPQPVKGGDEDQFRPKISPKSPIQPMPLKDDQDEYYDFPSKTVQSIIERQRQATPARRPFQPMSPLKGDQDDYSPKQTTLPKAPFQRKSLNGTDQDGFPAKTYQISDESQRQPTHMEGPILQKRHVDYQDDFADYKTLHGIESKKQPKVAEHQPMLLEDYHNESPPKVGRPLLPASAKHGDQKRLEGQEKVTGGEQKSKPLIGLADFVEKEKIGEVKGNKGIITQSFEGRNKTTVEKETMIGPSTSTSGGDFRFGNYKEAVKGLTYLNEERQLLVNAGVAVLVILALGAHIYNTVATKKSD